MKKTLVTACCAIVAAQCCNNSYARAQVEGSSPAVAGVTLKIEPVKNPLKRGDNLLMRVTIVNGTNAFLFMNVIPSLSSFGIEIHDADGKSPKETDEGCRRHQSPACAEERQNGGSGNDQTIYVLPHRNSTVTLDVGLEYLLDYASTFTIDVIEKYLVAVAAPPETSVFSLADFPHSQVGRLQSNSISVQVLP
jgi:hypothetical protein